MNELDQAFETLRNLLGRRNSGAQWGGAVGAKHKLVEPKPMAAVKVDYGYTLGASDEEIRDAGEELLLYRCGLVHQARLTRKNVFIASTQGAVGARLELNQIIMTDRQCEYLRGCRCLLALREHVGRKVSVAHKVADGIGCEIIRGSRQKRTILAHGATWVLLDQAPDPYGTGYPVLQFL